MAAGITNFINKFKTIDLPRVSHRNTIIHATLLRVRRRDNSLRVIITRRLLCRIANNISLYTIGPSLIHGFSNIATNSSQWFIPLFEVRRTSATILRRVIALTASIALLKSSRWFLMLTFRPVGAKKNTAAEITSRHNLNATPCEVFSIKML